VIRAKNNGEISEVATGKKEEGGVGTPVTAGNEIDFLASRYKAIVSVLMLKEGWDVRRNATVIVSIRVYSAKSNILPK